MSGRLKSMDGNHYSLIFAINAYFFKVYPMYSKRKAGGTLKMFFQELCVPEKITLDSSK